MTSNAGPFGDPFEPPYDDPYAGVPSDTGIPSAALHDKQPPNDQAAEQAVLGAMLLSKDLPPLMHQILRADDFYKPAHGRIYDAIMKLSANEEPADAVTVADELDKEGELQRIVGAPSLHPRIAAVPSVANAPYYAHIVAEKALLRRLVDAGMRITSYGYAAADGMDVDAMVDRAQAEIYEVTERRHTEDYKSLEDVLQPTMDEIEEIARNDGKAAGVPTGFFHLDELTNGLHAGQMIIIAARPGVGKSTLALDIMRNCSLKHDKTSVMFSLEMGRIELTMRLLSAEAQVRLADMRGGRLDDADWGKLVKRMSEIADKPLYIDDSPNITMMEIRAKTRRLKQQHGLDLVVVDYLQLMSSGKKVESRQQEVAEFSRQLKLLAKELEVPVIAVSQLNRGPEQRNDKRPQVSDLRESGSLEQDADMVLLLHRPEMFDPNDVHAGEAEIIVGKHRGGPTGTVEVVSQLHFSRFVNKARDFD